MRQAGSEVIAGLAPRGRDIKAFNTLYAPTSRPTRRDAGRQVVFYADDDPKTTFNNVLNQFGFAPVDVGDLHHGGQLMQVRSGQLSALHILK